MPSKTQLPKQSNGGQGKSLRVTFPRCQMGRSKTLAFGAFLDHQRESTGVFTVVAYGEDESGWAYHLLVGSHLRMQKPVRRIQPLVGGVSHIQPLVGERQLMQMQSPTNEEECACNGHCSRLLSVAHCLAVFARIVLLMYAHRNRRLIAVDVLAQNFLLQRIDRIAS